MPAFALPVQLFGPHLEQRFGCVLSAHEMASIYYVARLEG
jgi:hypothetical protein